MTEAIRTKPASAAKANKGINRIDGMNADEAKAELEGDSRFLGYCHKGFGLSRQP